MVPALPFPTSFRCDAPFNFHTAAHQNDWQNILV